MTSSCVFVLFYRGIVYIYFWVDNLSLSHHCKVRVEGRHRGSLNGGERIIMNPLSLHKDCFTVWTEKKRLLEVMLSPVVKPVS